MAESRKRAGLRRLRHSSPLQIGRRRDLSSRPFRRGGGGLAAAAGQIEGVKERALRIRMHGLGRQLFLDAFELRDAGRSLGVCRV